MGGGQSLRQVLQETACLSLLVSEPLAPLLPRAEDMVLLGSALSDLNTDLSVRQMMSWKSLFSSPDQAETTGLLAEIRKTTVKCILF